MMGSAWRAWRTHLQGAALALLLAVCLGGCAAQAVARQTPQPTVTPTANAISKHPVPNTTPEATPTNVVIVGTPGVYGPTCQPKQLTLTMSFLGAAMSNDGQWATFTNHSTSACSLYGFPGAQLLDAQRHPMMTRVHGQTSAYLYSLAEQRVQLVPGASAYFIVEWVQAGDAETPCFTTAYLEVTPPYDVGALTVSDRIYTCGGDLYLSPVEPNQKQFMGS